MAATDDEWERLFRERFDDFESEPEDDALSQILGKVKAPVVEKPGGFARQRLGLNLALFGILGVLTVGVWQDTEEPVFGKTADPGAVTSLKTDPKPAIITVSPDTVAAPPVATSARRTEGTIKQEAVRAVKRAIAPTSQRTAFTRSAIGRPDFSEADPVRLSRSVNQNRPLMAQRNPVPERNPAYAINSTIQSSIFSPVSPEVSSSFVVSPVATRPIRLSFPKAVLPEVQVPPSDDQYVAPVIEPKRQVARPSVVASFMPLYTFRQVLPTRQDEVVMEKIRLAKSLSARTGWRLQAGAEWQLNRVFGLRVSVVYQQLQQQMTYTARALRSDSSKIEWVDNQTIKLTPLYKSQERHVKTTWQHVALSAEGRLQLNPGRAGLRHYFSAGGSLGYLIDGRSRQNWQPLLQASYGIERRLTENLRLQVEPGIVYNLSAINDHSRCFSVRPYSYGLVVGLRWQPDI
ncbi:hypothetical protein ACFPMF_12130 [Larkinella bovis]|uniref:Outer membrane protein beta-barrel domain-containing protein n=1 Tax=Larkinella bovis TaxID=683041 RepID=A0ABW0IFB9_9BACT